MGVWSEKCRDAMKNKKISYSKMADMLHRSKAHTWRILNSKAAISIGEIEHIDAILKTRIMDYWTEEEYQLPLL
jgi:transcriptional regulator with XRE-family HTH domain